MINQVLVELGFMCNNNDKMYTMQPSKIYFYQQNITSSDDISLLKLDVCIFLFISHKRIFHISM